MIDKPDPTAMLDAAHLEAVEDQYSPGLVDEPPPALTLAEAVDALRRIGYHQRQVVIIELQAMALIAPLQQEIDQIKAWAAEQVQDRKHRIAFHENRLAGYYWEHPPTKGKTLKLPGGSIAAKAQQPEWVYEDADALLQALRNYGNYGHAAVRTKYEVDKAALKALTVITEDGQVVDGNTGLVFPGVRVQSRLDKFVVEID